MVYTIAGKANAKTMRINLGKLFFVLILLLCSCNNRIFTNDVFFCQDILYFKSSKKAVTGKVFSLFEDGSSSGYEEYNQGILNGEFKNLGYEGEIVHRGVNTAFKLEGELSFLKKEYLRLYLTEFSEGDLAFRYLTLVSKHSEKQSNEEGRILDSLKLVLEGYFTNLKGQKFKADKLIIDIPKDDKDCQFLLR